MGIGGKFVEKSDVHQYYLLGDIIVEGRDGNSRLGFIKYKWRYKKYWSKNDEGDLVISK